MGNEVSHKRSCCRKSMKFERPATVQENRAVDLPIAETALGAVLWSSVNHPPKEESQDTATGMKNKDRGRRSEIASSSLPVAQITVRTTELQDLGEARPSAEQFEENENKPTTTTSPDRQTCAPTQERPATAQQAERDTELTTDLPLQTATETGARDAEDVVTDQATVESNSIRKRLSDKLCKPSPLCRWLKKLRSPAEKVKEKPDAITSQE